MLVLGAGGFAMQLLDTLAELNMENNLVFFDDTMGSECRYIHGKFPVINSMDLAIDHFEGDKRFLLGTGNPSVRKMLLDKFNGIGGNVLQIISPSLVSGKYNVNIGYGVSILHGVVIESGVSIGDGCLINLNCTITHGSILGNFCEIGPGAMIAGNAQIGEYSTLGAGAIILPNVKVGKHVTVAAGAVVTKDMPDNVMVAGIPAIIKKSL